MNENIEKVLAALDGFRMSDEMTYSAYSVLYDEISLLDDLLKEREPRVLTLQEAETWVSSDPDLRDPIFYEDSVMKRGWWITHDNDRIYLPRVNEGYGRCWTSRPTDEQRKTTPWEPPKEKNYGC